MKIAVLGAGSWGSAITKLLYLKGHEISVWARREVVAESLKRGENPYYLPGIPFPKVFVSTNIKEVIDDSEIVVFAIPAQYMRNILKMIKEEIKGEEKIILNLAKGIEIKSKKRMEEVFLEELGNGIKYATLSGPSHAEEVAREIPTSVVVASRREEVAKLIQREFSSVNFRIYTNDDIVGVELAGALKNVIAIAVGIIDGLGGWDNSKAALITRALVEITRFGVSFGAKKETFMGLAGIGDLIVTCMSLHSRNRHVGEMIGKGKKLEDILNEMNMVAEGVYTVKAVVNMAKERNIEIPIMETVYEILYENLEPRKALHQLMRRELKSEAI